MSQIIGTVNVQTGPSNPNVPNISYDAPLSTVSIHTGTVNQKVPSINYGGSKTIKGSTDLSMVGAQDNYVISYQLSTDSFVMKNAGDSIADIDAGFF